MYKNKKYGKVSTPARKRARYGNRTKKSPAFNHPANVPKSLVDVGLGFPSKIKTKLKYTGFLPRTSTTGTIDDYVFSLNGLYDTDITGGGHQPMYFDQFMAIYNHYTVIGSKIKLTAAALQSNTVPAVCCLWPNDDSTITPGGVNARVEQSGNKHILVGSTGDSVREMTLGFSAKKVFGGDPLAQEKLQGDASNNPSDGYFAVVSTVAADGVSTVSVTYQVDLEYIVVFDELKDIGTS